MAKNNKTIEDMAFNSIKVEPIVVPTEIDVKSYNGKYVKWGVDNKMPLYLYDSYLSCSNLQSILLTYADYIGGDKINSSYEFVNSEDETIQEVLKKAIMDYVIFGCFSLECIRNGKGDIVDIIYQDMRNVRVSEDMRTAYIASEWGSFQGKNCVELPLWDRKEKQPHFIYYYAGNSRGWYGTPLYFAAMKSVEILKRTRDFHLKNLENNFSANAIITFCNGTPSKTTQKEIFDNLNNSFCGTENASKLFINFCDNKDAAPKVERLTEDKFGDLYKSLAESSVEDIYQACRLNKMLLGANVQTGFSKEEFLQAAELFQRTTISPIQNDIIKAFRKLGIEITIDKYKFED